MKCRFKLEEALDFVQTVRLEPRSCCSALRSLGTSVARNERMSTTASLPVLWARLTNVPGSQALRVLAAVTRLRRDPRFRRAYQGILCRTRCCGRGRALCWYLQPFMEQL